VSAIVKKQLFFSVEIYVKLWNAFFSISLNDRKNQ